MQKILERDKTWQVRAAACENLARLRTRHAIPALISGYAAELKRKKDPWAMDMRLHRTLEGLTGQAILPGNAGPWEAFWKAEGAYHPGPLGLFYPSVAWVKGAIAGDLASGAVLLLGIAGCAVAAARLGASLGSVERTAAGGG